MGYLPLVFISTLLAALVNYHRPILSWCGVPGLTVYIPYIAGVIILRGRCRIDPKLGKVQDVARFALTLLAAAIPSAGNGTLTLLGDNLISRSDALKTAINWWSSDAIAIITFSPFLLLYVAPRVILGGHLAGLWLGGCGSLSASLSAVHSGYLGCGPSWSAGRNPHHVCHQRGNDVRSLRHTRPGRRAASSATCHAGAGVNQPLRGNRGHRGHACGSGVRKTGALGDVRG